jgi:hypothetical protein
VSVIVIAKFPGDTGVFKASLSDRSADYVQFVQESRGQGAIHHRFAVGDGFVLVIDEWDSASNFERFMASPELQAFIAEVGASGPPEVIVAEAVSSPDQF